MSPNEFVEYFMCKYKTLLNRVCKKYTIPNRYTIEDIKQYIAEKITSILVNRQESGSPINNPEGYFKSCLDYYGIEFQRMHGYIFHLPKRPRKNSVQEEAQIKSYGFKYLKDLTVEENNSLYTVDEKSTPDTKVWESLVDILTPEERQVIECIYIQNLTWSETSQYLGVAQSTCWFRKNRALIKIQSAFLAITGKSLESNLKDVIRGNIDIYDQNS